MSDSSIPSVKFAAVFSDLCTLDPVTGQPKMAEQFKVSYIILYIIAIPTNTIQLLFLFAI